ncbi:MAG: hypothetical protein II006_03500 [Peptostreptococcaceae bacterium]|nr:hypothetical protein [Peptostreptococcaceae bacterium]
MKERTKNIIGVLVFLLIEVVGIILIDYRIANQNAAAEATARTNDVVYKNNN